MGGFYQTLNKELIILHKLFQKIEERSLLNSFHWGQYYPDTKTKITQEAAKKTPKNCTSIHVFLFVFCFFVF